MDKLLIKERLTLIDSYCNELENIKDLSYEEFANSRNSAAAESYLRRSLEAVFDIGRHILAKTGGGGVVCRIQEHCPWPGRTKSDIRFPIGNAGGNGRLPKPTGTSLLSNRR